MDDTSHLASLRERLKVLKRRRDLLLAQLDMADPSASVTLRIQVEDGDKKIEQLEKELGDVSDDTPVRSSKKRSISSTRIVDRHIIYIEKIIAAWNERLEVLEEKLKINKSDVILRKRTLQVREYVNYLLTRRDTVELFKVLDGEMKISQMYIYAGNLLAHICKLHSQSYIMEVVRENNSDEIEEMIREARDYLNDVRLNGVTDRVVYYRLAILHYILGDVSDELIFEYCKNAVERDCSIDYIIHILIDVSGRLANTVNKYQEDAKKIVKRFGRAPIVQQANLTTAQLICSDF